MSNFNPYYPSVPNDTTKATGTSSQTSNAAIKEPPIGIKPREVALEERKNEIISAICRYAENNYIVPEKWFMELNEIIKRMEVNET